MSLPLLIPLQQLGQQTRIVNNLPSRGIPAPMARRGEPQNLQLLPVLIPKFIAIALGLSFLRIGFFGGGFGVEEFAVGAVVAFAALEVFADSFRLRIGVLICGIVSII